MRRGLTMLELLISLALLALMLGVVMTWTRTAANASVLIQPARLRHAAQAVFDLIQQDLLVGDFPTESQRQRSQGPSGQDRIEIADGALLRVRTRGCTPASGGAVTHEYRFDPQRRELSLVGIDHQGHRAEPRLLVDGIDQWTCDLDDEHFTLTITIITADGVEHTRRFKLR
jgi:prepilin-type N-terminal cleavage/methylation domain-containing protein